MIQPTDHPKSPGPSTNRSTVALCILIALAIAAAGGAMGYLGSDLFRQNPAGSTSREALPTAWEVLISLFLCLGAYEIFRHVPMKLRWLGVALSLAASVRYITWRFTYTLNFDTAANTVACYLLLGAEMYALLMLFLGHFQTSWPTERQTPRMPPGAKWPCVDVYITTYNEEVDLVRRTAIGCQAIDYPNKQVYILDDGNRPEMKALADEVGVNYISREDNQHAKAGNLNHALTKTSGDLIAQFDADHVPVKSFLRETVPFFLWDDKLAFVQTPHYFYNLDAFQRNLLVKDKVANEQDLFFRVIQPGNDRWNAAFFCGSNAVLKREALDAIGGFATETITEDAHTALRMHANKWHSVYLKRNLAGGLAAESFADIFSQRIRWGMGMCRILSVDNPLFIRGLRLAQRLCYLTASVSFFYGFPRVIYFLAPVVFMLCGVSPISANVAAVSVYILPHLIAAILLTSAISHNVRHTYWSEVFESAMAFPMSVATVWSIFTRKKLAFKVTPKNAQSQKLQFNPNAMIPQFAMLGCTLAAIGIGLTGLPSISMTGVMMMNLFWCFYNVIILSGAVIATIDRPQMRKDTRVPCFIPAQVSWTVKGQLITTDAATADLSEGGAHLLTRDPLPENVELDVRIGTGPEQTTLQAKVTRVGKQTGDGLFGVSVSFKEPDTPQRHQLIRLMYTDPNRWSKTPDNDDGWTAFVNLAGSSFRWMNETERPTLRRSHRIPIDRPAVLRVDNRPHIAKLVDLTQSGALIEGHFSQWKRGTPVNVMITLSSGAILNLSARVARRNEDGVAITFQEMSDQQRADLLWDLYVVPMAEYKKDTA